MRPGEEVDIEITGINHQGEGVGRAAGVVMFVPGTVPGERVYVRVTEVHKNYARGAALTVTSPSAHRATPACGLSGRCGGCSLQHINYAEQLRLKTKLVKDSMARIGGAGDAPVRDIIGMRDPWHYRNNVRFQVRRHPGGVALGFFAQESHQFIAGVTGEEKLCLLAHRDINRAVESVCRVLEETPADVDLPGELVLRRGSTGQLMVVLIGGAGQARGFADLAENIAGIAGVVSVVQHTRPQGKKIAGRFKTLCGPDYIEDELEGLVFMISAASFYQVNPQQTAVLYRQALEYCALQGSEEVADAYCGVGTIALYLARHAGAVRGYEVVPQAVRDAGNNAARNKITNARFNQGAVERVLPEQVAKGYRPDVVVLDPPRAGCRPEVIQALAASGVPRVVYVSCDPATLARDIKRLAEKGYGLEEVQPVDMFPHTHHVESIILMTNSGLKGK